MCTTCGCGSATIRIDADAATYAYRRVPPDRHRHDGGAWQGHAFPPSPAASSPSRRIEVERDLLAANDIVAMRLRRRFTAAGVLALNVMSSPGSGKTTLLVRSIRALAARHSIAVIEGDQQTSRDAERIRETRVPALQINTGKGCHLDASMIERALDHLPLPSRGLLLIENVGNLVCPAAFDLGEGHKVVILSVTEGDDKPLKYPDMFAAADLCIVSKIDLLPHVTFDVDAATEYARRMQPNIEVLRVSAKTGEGMHEWVEWIERELQTQQPSTVPA